MPENPDQRWNVLYTKPYREEMVRSWLSEQGSETYLPLVRARGKRPTDRMVPFFPCYVFAQLHLDRRELTSLGWTPGLRRVVSFGGVPATVGTGMLRFIADNLDEINQAGWTPFRPGDRVLVTEGPFRDLVGIFSRTCSSAKRVQILLDVVGRQTRCEIDLASLKKL